ncbi:MAG: biotin synthase BioB [Clostridiales Family XIII bacterium]|nr:biotin synthase BioB [Clostridiales Family XIII bacterium]
MGGGVLTRGEVEGLMALPDEDVAILVEAVFPIRRKYKGMKVGIQLLTNARSGGCTQNCSYCAQSSSSEAAIEKYTLVSREKLEADSRAVGELGLARHCIGLSGIRFSDGEIEELASYVESMKVGSSAPVCCSIGFLTEAQARRLKDAGVDRINHNLNTSRTNYANICTTHTYDERVANIRMLQGIGFEICCGGIVGMGEGDDGVVDLLLAIRDIEPQAVPINFLLPIGGTGLAGSDTVRLTPEYCLKALCLARLLLPRADIRCAAGREAYLAGRERDLFKVADSIFASGYLTAGGQPVSEAIELVRSSGFEYAAG